jgi:hypothetical protein
VTGSAAYRPLRFGVMRRADVNDATASMTVTNSAESYSDRTTATMTRLTAASWITARSAAVPDPVRDPQLRESGHRRRGGRQQEQGHPQPPSDDDGGAAGPRRWRHRDTPRVRAAAKRRAVDPASRRTILTRLWIGPRRGLTSSDRRVPDVITRDAGVVRATKGAGRWVARSAMQSRHDLQRRLGPGEPRTDRSPGNPGGWRDGRGISVRSVRLLWPDALLLRASSQEPIAVGRRQRWPERSTHSLWSAPKIGTTR